MQLRDIGYSKKAIFASAMFLVLTLLIVMVPLTVAHSGSSMYAPPLSVPATIDGAWSAGEWDDAPQYTMVGNQTSYIRAKFNSTHLLVIIDSPWDTTNSTLYWHENMWLAFDTAHDNGWAPQWDDYLIHATTSWTSMAWAGNGTAWNQTWVGWAGTVAAAQGGMNFGGATPLLPSPNSFTPHRISEMAVPLTLVGYPGSTVGFYAQVDDDSTDPDGPDPPGWLPATAYSEWPSLSGGSPGWPGPWGPPSAPCAASSAWGDLTLSSPVGGTTLAVDKLSLLAPYIALVSMIAVAGATAIYFIRRKKKML